MSQPLHLGSSQTFKEFITTDTTRVSELRHRKGHNAVPNTAGRNQINPTIVLVPNPTVPVPTAVIPAKADVGSKLFHLRNTIKHCLARSILVELVSSDIEPAGDAKGTIKGYARRIHQKGDHVTYECNFKFPRHFGKVGAVLVENQHHKEVFLQDIVINGSDDGPITVSCNSWVHSKYDNPQKRIFFSNKSFLPSETPIGLKKLREEELLNLRGNGQGQRKTHDRIYDYDVYNDLGNPDTDSDQKRPVLGGKLRPYPRRCRTGGPSCKTDPESEKRSSTIYVPRDEQFSEIKNLSFYSHAIYTVLHAVLPALDTLVDEDLAFCWKNTRLEYNC